MPNLEFIPSAKPIIGDDERRAVDAVLASGMIAQGPKVEEFENKFGEKALADSFAVAVNSGTSALHLGLLAAGIGPGDEVIVPSFTFAATGNSVAAVGATPVFADVDEYFCLDAEDVKSRITDRTKGIMPVHLYGHPANLTALQQVADEAGIEVFEDCAQAHLATWGGKPVGTFGKFGAFSFYPTKNMTTAEGGAVSTNDPDVRRKVQLLRNQGMEVRYQNELVGFNNRMTDVHAAIGLVQLEKLAGWTETRQKNASFLSSNISEVVTPKVHPEATHVYHQYTVLVEEDRDGFQKALADEHGVGSGVYYPVPNHRLPSLNGFAEGVDLPQTEKYAKQCLSLPVHPSLSEADLNRIVEAVNLVAKAGA
ncbi:aminotransferase DegT [Corynebacterium sp. HMSC11D10]|uniref:DegT/DnrJ/EryC1/StrS family aminotransferase n=1 Tax=Corynebacterium sp. HMSC11D10 TaxID=1581088 RepID=UPI0008A11E02|nr:DegT/DnrJ/EryC1/StrS family aminotransferase [Corynebacterium sp. HMSC11D10]OFU51727.1 aminotransferase DegT [Corynebacterium sp. HMSC11D10]